MGSAGATDAVRQAIGRCLMVCRDVLPDLDQVLTPDRCQQAGVARLSGALPTSRLLFTIVDRLVFVGAVTEGGVGRVAGFRQGPAVERISRRHPNDDESQRSGGAAVDAGAPLISRQRGRSSPSTADKGEPAPDGASPK